MLSCSCDDDYDNWVEPAKDFEPLSTKRSRRCGSCEKKIAVGEICLNFKHWRNPRSDYEESRHGDEVLLADLYMCESCGEIWLNLTDLGYCLSFGDIRDDLQYYWEMTGFHPDSSFGVADFG